MQQAAPTGEEPELYDSRSVTANNKAISYVRTIMTIVSGSSAGILGLTGLKGFAFYILTYVVTSVALLFKMGYKANVYVPKTTNVGFLYSGMAGEALAFVLYWTLSFALVNIY